MSDPLLHIGLPPNPQLQDVTRCKDTELLDLETVTRSWAETILTACRNNLPVLFARLSSKFASFFEYICTGERTALHYGRKDRTDSDPDSCGQNVGKVTTVLAVLQVLRIIRTSPSRVLFEQELTFSRPQDLNQDRSWKLSMATHWQRCRRTCVNDSIYRYRTYAFIEILHSVILIRRFQEPDQVFEYV
ncbi:hypothetical protein MPTK2_3g17680 [Marchantia polymorpha subsp. ruderalis]